MRCIPPNPRRVGYIVPLDGPLYMGSHIHQHLHFCFSFVLIQVHLVKVTLHYRRARMKDIRLLIYLNKGSQLKNAVHPRPSRKRIPSY